MIFEVLLSASIILLGVNGKDVGCDDVDPKCPEWASEGECTSNAVCGSTSNPGQVVSKVLAANYTGLVYLWADFSFTTPFKFQYEDYPNDMQNVCFKFDDKRLLAVHFIVSDGVKNKERESTTDPFVSGWKVVDVAVKESPYSIEALSDLKKNPFDVQSDNCELCVSLQRNAVYFNTEMLLPALITSLFTIAAVFFQDILSEENRGMK
ncbi:hypothetical protein DICVIV_12763 [Dictyocaulus viviparus]|uniref:Uncharacterized protein n=1 Tax=Dictyocaulus viviparus TaxID=29172 RepID=A0A0D8XFY2_DICVI|nr:hypothetical protein DICVIV_12763 [Dictyocaulus viviparus]